MSVPASVPADAPRPAKLAHLVLRTADLDGAIDWWCTVLGAHVVHRNEVVAFLTYDDEHHRLALIGVGDAPAAPPGGPGFEHVAFTYDDLEALVTTYERLRAESIEPAWCVNHGMTLSMYYRDPDGGQVELQIDLCTPEEAADFMDGDEFGENPIGLPFDPAELARQHRAGEVPAALGIYGPRAAAGAS